MQHDGNFVCASLRDRVGVAGAGALCHRASGYNPCSFVPQLEFLSGDSFYHSGRIFVSYGNCYVCMLHAVFPPDCATAFKAVAGRCISGECGNAYLLF